MDLLKIEEMLAERSIVYISNPGHKEIKKLREYYEVTKVPNNQIKIKYKL